MFIKPDSKPPHQSDMDSCKSVQHNPKADPQDNAVRNQPHQNICSNRWNISFHRRIHPVCSHEPRNTLQVEQLFGTHSSHHSHHKLACTVRKMFKRSPSPPPVPVLAVHKVWKVTPHVLEVKQLVILTCVVFSSHPIVCASPVLSTVERVCVPK